MIVFWLATTLFGIDFLLYFELNFVIWNYLWTSGETLGNGLNILFSHSGSFSLSWTSSLITFLIIRTGLTDNVDLFSLAKNSCYWVRIVRMILTWENSYWALLIRWPMVSLSGSLLVDFFFMFSFNIVTGVSFSLLSNTFCWKLFGHFGQTSHVNPWCILIKVWLTYFVECLAWQISTSGILKEFIWHDEKLSYISLIVRHTRPAFFS